MRTHFQVGNGATLFRIYGARQERSFGRGNVGHLVGATEAPGKPGGPPSVDVCSIERRGAGPAIAHYQPRLEGLSGEAGAVLMKLSSTLILGGSRRAECGDLSLIKFQNSMNPICI